MFLETIQPAFLGMAGEEYKPKIRAVTPTMGRPAFLEGQYNQFVSMSARYGGLTEWVIVDVSPEPCEFLDTLEDPRVHYLHLPSRRREDMGALFAEHPELKSCVVGTAEEAISLHEDMLKLKAEKPAEYPPRITPLADWSLISLGEQRNISLRLDTGSKAPEIIVQLDDDDFYHPDYFKWAKKQMESADFVRQGCLFQHIAENDTWLQYQYKSDLPTKKIRTTGEVLEVIQPAELERRQAEGQMNREGFGFGLGFIYKASFINDMFAKNQMPFPAMSLYEDAILARRMVDAGAVLHFPKGDNPMICRILHSRKAGHGQANISQETRMHIEIPAADIKERFPDMHSGVKTMVAYNVDTANNHTNDAKDTAPQKPRHNATSMTMLPMGTGYGT